MKLKNTLVILLLTYLTTLLSGCSTSQELKEESTPTVKAEENTAKKNTSTVKSADGSPIFYGSRGEGETTIVFVHCWTCNHQFWEPQIEYFSQDYKVVWLDLAGHGKSGSQRQEYTMSAFGNDVAAVVNQVATDKVILVGHSMGGPVVIEAAKLLGDRVIGIVGVDTFYTPFEYPTSEEKIEEFIGPFKNDFQAASEQLVNSMFTPSADPELIETIVEQMGSADQDMAVSAMREIFRWNAQQAPTDLEIYSAKLRNINGAPTGKETALDESVTLIRGVGHFVAQAKPDEFNQVLEQIITEYQMN